MSEEVLRLEVVDASPKSQSESQVVPSDASPGASSFPASQPALPQNPASVAQIRPDNNSTPTSSLPEKTGAKPWGKDEDPVVDAVREIAGSFADLDIAINKFHDTLDEIEKTRDETVLPFMEGMDEKDFNDFGMSLSEQATKNGLDDLDDPSKFPPTFDYNTRKTTKDQHGNASGITLANTPPDPSSMYPPPPPPMGKEVSYDFEGFDPHKMGVKAIGGMMQTKFGQTLAQTAGSSVGAAVGSATGSGLAGTAAGMGASMGVSALASAGPVGLAVAGIVAGGLVLQQAFSKLSDMASKAAESIKDINGEVATAYSEREIAQMNQDMRRSDRMGSELADQVRAETDLDIAIQELGDNVTELFLPFVTEVTEVLTVIVDILNGIFGNTKPKDNFDHFQGIEEIVQFVNPLIAAQRFNQRAAAAAGRMAGGGPLGDRGVVPPRGPGMAAAQRKKMAEEARQKRAAQHRQGKKDRRAAAGLPPLKGL